MILKKIKFMEDGDVESVWMINMEQYQMLINYAVNTLLKEGIAKVVEMDQVEFLKSGTEEEKQEFLKYLEETDTDKMFKA